MTEQPASMVYEVLFELHGTSVAAIAVNAAFSVQNNARMAGLARKTNETELQPISQEIRDRGIASKDCKERVHASIERHEARRVLR